jgi:hypothetical protein
LVIAVGGDKGEGKYLRRRSLMGIKVTRAL